METSPVYMERPSGLRQLLRCVAACAIATVVAITAACGGDDKGDDGGGGGGGGNGGGSQVTSGSRLSWSQAAASSQQVQSMQFRIYVDNSPMSMSAVNCAASAAAGAFDCSGLLPTMSAGRHVLELSSILSGVESMRSDPLTVTVNGLTTQVEHDEVSDAAPGAGAPQSNIVCLDDPEDCYVARVVAAGLGEATAVTALPDGRVLFIEDGSRVRVIADDTLLPVPALTLPEPDARLLSLAVDSSSPGTTSVFVAWTVLGADGRPLVNVTRYREVADTLGEGATIVTGLPFLRGAAAPIAVDRLGLLYVALPATGLQDTTDPRPGAGSGVILRFTRDGLVPAINWRGLPVIAAGYGQPSSIAVDREHDRMWLAGSDPGWASPVSMLTIAYHAEFAANHAEPVATSTLEPGRGPVLALLEREQTSGASLLVAAGGRLLSGPLNPARTIDGLQPSAAVPSSPFDFVASAPHGKWYTVKKAQESGVSLISLTPVAR